MHPEPKFLTFLITISTTEIKVIETNINRSGSHYRCATTRVMSERMGLRSIRALL